MNLFLWILQVLLALHTIMGAAWKFTNSAQTVESLKAIPHGLWVSLTVLELISGICLVLPAISKKPGTLAPIAASFIAIEMVIFCIVGASSSEANMSEIMYWAVVALVSAFLAYGRFSIKPL